MRRHEARLDSHAIGCGTFSCAAWDGCNGGFQEERHMSKPRPVRSFFARGAMMVGAVTAVATVSAAGVARAEPPSDASNMGICSSFLAQLEVPGVGNVRASVNHVIKEFGPL